MTMANSGSEKLELLLTRIAASKDEAAFAELYSATKGKLFSTVLRIVKRRDCAEEILQDVYVRIWHHANSYRSSSASPMTWMITIARNLSIDMVRKLGWESHCDDSMLLELPADSPTALEIIESSEDQQATIRQRRDIITALQSLSPMRRDLVIAAYIHGESREQLSKRTGVPVNTVKTWIRRALLDVEKNVRGMEGLHPTLSQPAVVFETALLQSVS
jgi:RNA polymerase sigma-70 factor (ECF subfamily)